MTRLLLALWLLQAGPQGTGVVTGVVRSSSGSPSPRVRVYAVTYRDAVEAAKSPPALESLTETDASGKYRLELPPGRYHIASGSVASPTYYPGTTDISAARVISVAADGVVSDINFGSFVPANRTPTGIGLSITPTIPVGNAILSGTLRFPDGKPASGISVIAIPVSAIGQNQNNGGTFYYAVGQLLSRGGVGGSGPLVVSDNTGRFRIENLGPETYHLLAGYADAPVFYPGTTDLTKAKAIAVTNTSRIDALDFEVPPSAPGVTLLGKVFTSADVPATGATVRIRSLDNPIPLAAALGMPVRNRPQEATVGGDGLFAFGNVLTGKVLVEALFSGIQSQIQNVVVTGQPMGSLDFILPIANVTGRLVMEDGSPVPNPQLFRDAIVTTVNNPNIVASTIFPIDAGGSFSRLHEGGEFRFYLRALPEEYEIKSMRFEDADLSKETLKITGKAPVNIEIRVAKRTSSPATGEVRVTGKVLDGASGLPVAAERIALCCTESGPVEGFSASVKADGTFEFPAVRAGKYTPAIQQTAGRPNIYVVESIVEIGGQGTTVLNLSATPQFGQLTAGITAAGLEPFPESFRPSVVFTNAAGKVRVVAQRTATGNYLATVPAGARYDVSVENLPEGYAVRSIIGDAVPVTGNAPNSRPVIIVIERK